MSAPVESHAKEHPSDAKYVQIALILGALTALEVSLFYIDVGPLEVPALLIMMMIKFFIVAAWFMHLRFDSVLFSRLFMAGLALAVGVYVATLSAFEFFD